MACLLNYVLTHKDRLLWAKMSITVENVLYLRIETCEAKLFLHTCPEVDRQKMPVTQGSEDFKDYPRNSCHTALYRTLSNVTEAQVLELKYLCLNIS